MLLLVHSMQAISQMPTFYRAWVFSDDNLSTGSVHRAPIFASAAPPNAGCVAI